uniref:hypothetical protein n=1 Tax=Vibrio crassostreae TaxID=246167 RepID=UPI001B3008A7
LVSDCTHLTRCPKLLVRITELPPQQRVTGDKEVDAYLWLRQIVSEVPHPMVFNLAEEAVKKLTRPLKELVDAYSSWAIQQDGASAIGVAFGTFHMDNFAGTLEGHRKKLEQFNAAKGHFGTIEAAFELTEPEAILVDRWVLDYGDRQESPLLRESEYYHMLDVLPKPTSITEVLNELEYWDELYSLRYALEECEQHCLVEIRIHWLECQLPVMPPASKEEAVRLAEYISTDDRLDLATLADTRTLIRNCVNY